MHMYMHMYIYIYTYVIVYVYMNPHLLWFMPLLHVVNDVNTAAHESHITLPFSGPLVLPCVEIELS